MNKKILQGILMLFTLALTFTSCSDDDDNTSRTAPATVTLQLPLDLVDATLSDAVVTLTNIQTGIVFTANKVDKADDGYKTTVEVPVGAYNVNVTGKVTYSVNNVQTTTDVKATANGFSVQAGQNVSSQTLSLAIYNSKAGFVISEIYYTGSLSTTGKAYKFDQYIVITNNSDETLYADSIAILQSAFSTDTKWDYTPALMDKAMTVHAVYMIPGNGKDHPVAPGKSIVIAPNAKDHHAIDPSAIDLSGADFEFFDESSSATNLDEDNKATNLDKWYSSTKSYFLFNNKGNEAYAIAKMQGSKDDFLKNNMYTYTYKFVFGDFAKDMSGTGALVPNAWIIDAVNLGMSRDYAWGVVSSALDKGYTFCAADGQDASRYGTAVIRRQKDGKYVDTNNSTDDFTAKAAPSLKK